MRAGCKSTYLYIKRERLRISIHISKYFQTLEIMEKTLSDKNEPNSVLCFCPAEVRGACSEPWKSRFLANDYPGGPARAKQYSGYLAIFKVLSYCYLLHSVSCVITPSVELSKEAATAQLESFFKPCVL